MSDCNEDQSPCDALKLSRQSEGQAWKLWEADQEELVHLRRVEKAAIAILSRSDRDPLCDCGKDDLRKAREGSE